MRIVRNTENHGLPIGSLLTEQEIEGVFYKAIVNGDKYLNGLHILDLIESSVFRIINNDDYTVTLTHSEYHYYKQPEFDVDEEYTYNVHATVSTTAFKSKEALEVCIFADFKKQQGELRNA